MSASSVFSAAATGRFFVVSPPSFSRSAGQKTVEAANAKEKTIHKAAEILAQVGAISRLPPVLPASRLEVRPAPEMVGSGIPQLDTLTGGFARGCLTEICGSASSGRTSVLLHALARATERGEVCALVDTSDAFHPPSAAAAGMDMSRLLWVRCGRKFPERRKQRSTLPCGGGEMDENQNFDAAEPKKRLSSGFPQSYSMLATPVFPAVNNQTSRHNQFSMGKNQATRRWESPLEQVLKVTDFLLQSNGFGMIALDLGDVPPHEARRIPLASWFRFRRVIEHTPTVLLVVEQQPIVGSCSSVLLKVSGARPQPAGKLSDLRSPLSGSHSQVSHSQLLDQFEISVELLRSRLERKLERKAERKPVRSTASFRSRAAWAG